MLNNAADACALLALQQDEVMAMVRRHPPFITKDLRSVAVKMHIYAIEPSV